MQTSVCVLVAARKGFLGTLNLFVGVLAKLALSFILLQIPSINIFGSAISAAACYLVVAALNLFVIMRHYKFEPSAHVALKPLLCSTVAIAFAFGAQKLFEVFLGQNLSLALSIALSLPVYAFACLKLEVLSGSEIGLLSLPRKVKGDDPTGV
jgi:stage V sporulation protein B